MKSKHANIQKHLVVMLERKITFGERPPVKGTTKTFEVVAIRKKTNEEHVEESNEKVD